MSDIKLHLFGEPDLKYQEVVLRIDRRKVLALLSYLVLSEHRQNRDLIATLLWPDLDQQHARTALRSNLSRLSTLLPGKWIHKSGTALALNHETIWVDVVRFRSLLRQSRSHQHESNRLCDVCVRLVSEAVTLYRADFMAGFSLTDSVEYDDWQSIQREWLRRDLSYALRQLASYYSELQDFESALTHARRWLALDPLHEPAHRMLMSLYAASGQRTEAVRQYQQCVDILNRELTTPPEDETQQLYATIQNDSGVYSGAAQTPEKQQTSILPTLPSLVIGREQALSEIKNRVGADGEIHAVTVMQGLPGVGKSTIIAMLAHDTDIRRCFPDGILWTSLGEIPSLITELGVWAEAVGVVSAASERRLESMTAQLTAALRDRRMLLIVDDVWQVEHVTPFKVGGQGCAMILTSRLNDVAQALAPTAHDIYRLEVLAEEAALELLEKLTPETVRDYPDKARELVRNLGNLPLALQVAGRLLHAESRLGWGVNNLLQELRAGTALLKAQAPGDMAKISYEASPTISALLKRSTDLLDYETRQRFTLLGLFVPKPATFDLSAMATAWNVSDAKHSARILVNRGLLEPLSGGRFQMHALLVLHARMLFEDVVDEITAKSRENASLRLARYYLSKLHDTQRAFRRGHEHSTDALALFDQEWSQIKYWHDWLASHVDDDEVANLCKEYTQSGTQLILLRQHPEEQIVWLEAGLIASQRLGDQQAEMVHLFLFGEAYRRLALFDRGLACIHGAFILAQQLDDALYASRCLISEGIILYIKDAYSQAKIAYEQALALSQALDAKVEIGLALNGLGNIALSLSENELAYDYYRQSLEISEAYGYPTDICVALRNLSLVTKRLGNLPMSIAYIERGTALCRVLGYQEQLGACLHQLGDLASTEGKLQDARAYYEESAAISRRINHSSNECAALNQLGALLSRLGDFPTSIECLEASFSLSKSTGERWYSALALMHLAEVFRLMGQVEHACVKLREGLDIVSTMQGPALRAKYLLEAALLWCDKGDIDLAAVWTGLLYVNVGKFTSEQRQLYDQLYQTLEAKLGREKFTAALGSGKTLDLNRVVEKLTGELN